jgi:hypothetical protein
LLQSDGIDRFRFDDHYSRMGSMDSDPMIVTVGWDWSIDRSKGVLSCIACLCKALMDGLDGWLVRGGSLLVVMVRGPESGCSGRHRLNVAE